MLDWLKLFSVLIVGSFIYSFFIAPMFLSPEEARRQEIASLQDRISLAGEREDWSEVNRLAREAEALVVENDETPGSASSSIETSSIRSPTDPNARFFTDQRLASFNMLREREGLKQVSVPSDPSARYWVVGQPERIGRSLNVLTARYSTKTREVSCARRDIRCASMEFRYTADSDWCQSIGRDPNLQQFSRLTQGSISWHVAQHVCR